MPPRRQRLELLAAVALLALGSLGCDAGQEVSDLCDEFCSRPTVDDPNLPMNECVALCRSDTCLDFCGPIEVALESDAGTEQCWLSCLAEAANPTEFAVYQLIEAEAQVRIDRLYRFTYNSILSDINVADMGSCNFSNTGIASANFRRPIGSNNEDSFSIADPRDGSIIWGLYNDQDRTEWVGPGSGSATIECFFDDKLFENPNDDEDPSPEDQEVDEDFIVCRLSWSGEASGAQFDDDNNVTRQTAHARIDVSCLYTTPDRAGCPPDDCDDNNPCTWDICNPRTLEGCQNVGIVAAAHPIDCTRDDGALGMCTLDDREDPFGPASCGPHPCGPDPCDDGDPCTYDFCQLNGSEGTCQSAPNSTCL